MPAILLSATLLSGVVLDPDRDQVLLMVEEGIAAVQASSGKRVWTSQSGARPLAVQGDRVAVIGAPNAPGGVAVLDARTGARAADCDDEVPATRFQVTNGRGVSVNSHGAIHNNQVMLTWNYHTYYAGGAAPTPGMDAAARSHSTGTVALDMASGCYVEARLPESPDWPPLQVTGKPQRMGPWTVGDTSVHIETVDIDGTREVRLHREVKGQPHQQTIASGRPGFLQALFTEDARAVLITIRSSAPDIGIGYTWRHVDLETGEFTDYGRQQFHPSGVGQIGQVLVAVQGQVVGVAPGGDIVWSENLRNTAYSGGLPP